MTTKPVLYLCGGINGLSDDEARGWRQQAIAEMGDLFEVLDPMRRDYRGREGEFFTKLVVDDLIDVQRADVLLVRAERPSWGTAMELSYAYRWGKRSVAFGVPTVEGASPWLRYHTQGLFPTLPEAMTYIRSLILKYGTVSASGSGHTSRNG